MKAERRRDKRYLRDDLNLTLPDGILARSVDISSRGLNCRTDKPIPEFSKLKVTLELPLSDGDLYQLSCDGVVVRCEASRSGGKLHYNLAVYFLSLDKERAAFIEDFLSLEKNHFSKLGPAGEPNLRD